MRVVNGLLVAGAINTDLVARMVRAPTAGETITGQDFSIHAGGKGGNQAVAAARSGAPVSILGAIGADDFGAGRLQDLRAADVDTAQVAVIQRESSGVAMIFVEESGENRIAYVPGTTLHVSPEMAARAVRERSPRIVLATNELPRDTLTALFKQAAARSIQVIFNATPDPASAHSLLNYVDILIVNEGEARALVDLPDDASPETIVRRLQDLGPEGVVMTLGADGVAGRYDGQHFRHRSPAVDVRDTTGAGDAFCGVLAAHMMMGVELSEAARIGANAGALAVTIDGAQSSIPDGDAIRQFMDGRGV